MKELFVKAVFRYPRNISIEMLSLLGSPEGGHCKHGIYDSSHTPKAYTMLQEPRSV